MLMHWCRFHDIHGSYQCPLAYPTYTAPSSSKGLLNAAQPNNKPYKSATNLLASILAPKPSLILQSAPDPIQGPWKTLLTRFFRFPMGKSGRKRGKEDWTGSVLHSCNRTTPWAQTEHERWTGWDFIQNRAGWAGKNWRLRNVYAYTGVINGMGLNCIVRW